MRKEDDSPQAWTLSLKKLTVIPDLKKLVEYFYIFAVAFALVIQIKLRPRSYNFLTHDLVTVKPMIRTGLKESVK